MGQHGTEEEILEETQHVQKSEVQWKPRADGTVFTIEDKSFKPWLGPSKPSIPQLQIHTQGVLKLLNQLKPHKAAGPGHIPNRVLEELSNERPPPPAHYLFPLVR
jgi:hypothetical protein